MKLRQFISFPAWIVYLFIILLVFLIPYTIELDKNAISEKYGVPTNELRMCMFAHRLGKGKQSRTYEYNGTYYTITWYGICEE